MATGYTFVAAGAVAQNANSAALTPGAPAGAAVGNLLLLYCIHRTAGESVAAITGWVRIAHNNANNGIEVFARIADGTATDTPSPDWSGTGGSMAWIEAWSGDVYAGHLGGLTVNGPTFEVTAGSAVPILPAQGISGVDRLVIVVSMKNKTTASDDATTITAPAGYTKRQQGIITGVASGIAAASASLQQTTAVDFDGTDFTINGTAESLTGTGLVFAIRTNAGAISTIVLDADTEHVRTDTASPQTFSHAGAASGVKGVVLMIMHGTSSTDHVSAASYGGVAMQRVQRNTDTATEAGAAEIWFLGSGVPQGTQTVSYTPGATTDDIQAVCATLIATGDLVVIDSDGTGEDQANPALTLSNGGRESIAFGALYSGLPAPTDFVENEDCARIHDHDYGAFTSYAFRQAYAIAGDFTIGGVSASDDVAFSAISVGLAAIQAGPALVSVRSNLRF